MARKGRVVTLSELSELVRAVTPEVLATMPDIGDAHAKLSEMVAEAQSLLVERSVHEARAQELSRRFDEIIESGRMTATFMRIGLRFHFGPDNERLTAFRIKPSRGRKRARKSTDPEPPPASGDTES